MSMSKMVITIIPLVDVFEELGIDYYIGGSVASSAYGFLRTTIDADIIADLRMEHVRPLVERLKDIYYIDADMIRDAIRHRSEFNVIHFETALKVDVFIPKTRSYEQEVRHRIQQENLDEEESGRLFYLAAPEDVILNKLEWYKMGGEVSDRQWKDVLGVLKVQGMALDMGYFKKWAGVLGVGDLLERALEDAGLQLS